MKTIPNDHAIVWLLKIGWLTLPLVMSSGICLSVCRNSLAQVATVKVNWDIGTAAIGDRNFNLTYRDAHLKLATRGYIDADPAPTTINGQFDNANTQTVHGSPDDCLIVDWTDAGTITGMSHIGAQLQVTNVGTGNAVRVVESRLTGVSGMAPNGSSFGEVPSLDVPGPQSITYRKARSAAVSFTVDNPAIIGPVTFSGVSFYKSATEPALADLDAASFPALPKTLLMSVPDFSVSIGTSMDFIVADIDVPEWLLVTYSTTWVSPALSALVGEPTSLIANTWFAGPMVPDFLPGDYNRNNVVDAADYPLWRKTVGAVGKPYADGNGDGIVNVLDYVVWRANFGITAAGSGAISSIPEPSTWLLFTMSGLASLLHVRRNPIVYERT